MKIIVGSKNPVKVGAVKEILKEYSHLANAEVVGVDANSDVSKQPTSLDETMRGAIGRAKNAYRDCDYSIGLESGLMTVPHSKTGYMDVCVCAIYDGTEFNFGLSSAWEFPKKEVLESMLHEGLDMNEAMFKHELTKKENIGWENGAIGYFTKGRMDRTEYTKQALRTALIHLDRFDI